MILSVNLPENAAIPSELSSFTTNDNLLMILIGSKSIHMIKNNYLSENMSSEIQKMRSEYENLLQKKEIENQIIKKVYDEIVIDEKVKQEVNVQNILSVEKNQLQTYYSDIINKYSNDNDFCHKTIENLNNEILSYKNELSNVEKDIIKKEESIKHYHINNELRIENEINNKIKMKEDDMKKQVDNYKEQLLLNERKYMNDENVKLQRKQDEIDILKEKLSNFLEHPFTIELELSKKFSEIASLRSFLELSKMYDHVMSQSKIFLTTKKSFCSLEVFDYRILFWKILY